VANSRIDELRKRLEKEPGSRLFAQLAEELRKEGELAEAIRVCRDGLLRNPGYPSARMTLGRALLDTGDMQAARLEFEAVLKGAPDNILASRLLAECHEGLGSFDAALEQYRKTLAMAPEDKLAQTRERELSTRLAALVPGPAAKAAAAEPPASPPPWADERVPARALPPEAPIPLADAEEEFELESAYESPAMQWATSALPVVPPAPAIPAEPAPERAPAAESLPPSPGPAGPQASLASPTLAELYLSQGLAGRAADVYRQVLDREPGNDTARARLAAIESADDDAPVAPAPQPGGRRAAAERTIARLEGLLSAIRRSAP
jgi:tetratricopeptide (TPR) repeat protein